MRGASKKLFQTVSGFRSFLFSPVALSLTMACQQSDIPLAKTPACIRAGDLCISRILLNDDNLILGQATIADGTFRKTNDVNFAAGVPEANFRIEQIPNTTLCQLVTARQKRSQVADTSSKRCSQLIFANIPKRPDDGSPLIMVMTLTLAVKPEATVKPYLALSHQGEVAEITPTYQGRLKPGLPYDAKPGDFVIVDGHDSFTIPKNYSATDRVVLRSMIWHEKLGRPWPDVGSKITLVPGSEYSTSLDDRYPITRGLASYPEVVRSGSDYRLRFAILLPGRSEENQNDLLTIGFAETLSANQVLEIRRGHVSGVRGKFEHIYIMSPHLVDHMHGTFKAGGLRARTEEGMGETLSAYQKSYAEAYPFFW